MEAQLREKAALLDQVPDAIYVRELGGRILSWSKGAERIFGWTAEEALGQNVRELIYRHSPADFDRDNATLLERGAQSGEACVVTKDGREIVAERRWTLVRDEAGEVKAVLVVMTDVTEKKQIEAQYLRAQRLESIGALASGITHDLCNIFSPILMSIDLLRRQSKDEETWRRLAVIERNAKRGVEMTRQVLGFARGAEGGKTALQLRHLIVEVEALLRETLPKTIEIESYVPTDLWTTLGDPTQLHQVLMNLCVNARDAMPSGGRLRLKAENVQLDQTAARTGGGAKPGRYVLISVADTGTGIPAGIIEKVFDPFFTTKKGGQGTGLGLATVASIVNSHRGFVRAYSEVGRGSEFKVYLPATEAKESVSAEEVPSALPTGQGELILVIDDEAAIREIVKEALVAYGYRVLTGGDGAEAVALYDRHKGQIRAVLIDLVMPRMSGTAAIRALREIAPEASIIATSGLKPGEGQTGAAGLDVAAFLAKPFSTSQLLETVAVVLGK